VEKELFDESSLRSLIPKPRENSLNFELMDDFIEMERLAESQSHSHSVSSSDHTTAETALVFGAADDSNHHLRITALEDALVAKDTDLEAANQISHNLSQKLTLAEDHLLTLQTRNAANEHSVIELQDRLDSLLESKIAADDPEVVMAIQRLVHITEALAQATGTESSPAAASDGSIAVSIHWQDAGLEASMGRLVQAANGLVESGTCYPGVLELVLGLAVVLDCILVMHVEVGKERDALVGGRLAVAMELESARVHVSELEEELCRVRADVGRKVQVQMARFPGLEAEIEQLRADKNELEINISEMDQHLVEANDRVEALRVRLSESEALVTELKTREVSSTI
jgi:chromosome segregation ATPase